MDNKCVECGNESDFMFAFTGQKLCGKCAFLYLEKNSKEKEEQMDSKCVQCGNDNDLMVAFTKHKVCGKCVKKNYKKVVKGK